MSTNTNECNHLLCFLCTGTIKTTLTTKQKKKKETSNMLSKFARDPDYCTISSNWALLPEVTWTSIKEAVLKKITPAAAATFMCSIYKVLFQHPKWKRPPWDLVPKHLCWLVLHCSSTDFASYGYEGKLPCNLSKSYIRKALDYILNQSASFVSEQIQPRPPEEMGEIAKER